MPGPQDSPAHRRGVRKMHEHGSHRDDATPTPEPDEKVPHRKARLGPGAEGVTNAGGIFKSAAVAILRQERRLMTTGDITRLALERSLINCQGKTPEATMASALYTDVRKKGNNSVFIRPVEGLFGLRDWEAEGFKPEGWPEGVPFTNSPICRKAGAGGHGRSRQGPGRASKARARDTWREPSADTESELGSDISGTPVSCRKRTSDESHGTSSNGALSILGDVCMSDFGNDDFPPKKRRPGALQVPEPSGRIIQPKSPLEDGLAALHEIATSPNPFGFLLSTGGKTKPQIILPAEDHDGSAEEQPGGPPSSCQPARFVAYTQPTPNGKQLVYMPADGHDVPMPLSATSPFPGYSKAAAQMWGGAASPSPECLVDSLVTPAALYAMGLVDPPEGMPAARSAMHSMDGSGSQAMPVLPSPRQQQQAQQSQQQTRRQGSGQLPRRVQPSPRSSGYKSSPMVPVQQVPQVPMFHPQGPHNPLQLAFIVPHHLHPALAGTIMPPGHLAAHHWGHPDFPGRIAAYRPGAVAIQVQAMQRSDHHRAVHMHSDPHGLHARAEMFENMHGRHHPEVFKHWMLVSQAYHSVAEARLAEQCIQRAKSCMDACLRHSGKNSSTCEAEFQYLSSRLKALSP